ncbi:MAG: tRNA epoxyqueuosine(34) reductase QueG [Gemmataceae bacterium]
MTTLENRIKAQAQELGFELVGIALATEAETYGVFRDWLSEGYAGEMTYLSKHGAAREHPRSIVPEVKSLVMVGMNYKPPEELRRPVGVEPTRKREPELPASRPNSGKVARYARGVDYHNLMWKRLDQLLEWLQGIVPECHGRGVVDTAPLLERDFARRAGLGWFGKNTMLLNKRYGSYFFLGALLLNIELTPDLAHGSFHCGSCTACLKACPTDAFVAPGKMDARRCISYLTIELRESVPLEFRPGMEDWVFGCDVCQEVCPWNRKAPSGVEPALQGQPGNDLLDLVELFELDEEQFRERFRGTPLTRPKRRGILRNAAIVLGNVGDESALPALERLTREEPMIAEAAQWAIEEIRRRSNP